MVGAHECRLFHVEISLVGKRCGALGSFCDIEVKDGVLNRLCNFPNSRDSLQRRLP
jgi:hypothetical protein